MKPGQLSKRVVADRIDWVERKIHQIRTLPLDSERAFLVEDKNVAAAESYLRRALEALLDLGRHVLAKGFGQGVSEYKEVATQLNAYGLLNDAEASLLSTMAGYRNRLVHFYHNVSPCELYQVCTQNLTDVEVVTFAIKRWIRTHPERMDETL